MPGLRDYEVSLLKLVEKVTNGSTIVINETGTAVHFSPGQLTGGKVLHECAQSRSVIYYLEVVAALAPMCKDSVILQLRGSTHDSFGFSADVFRSVTLPLLQKLGVANSEEAQLSFKVVSRGYGPNSNGCVIFTCPTVRFIAPIEQVTEGLVKRVRGVFWSAKMNREFSIRFVESARSILNKCIEDVWVYSEMVKDSEDSVFGGSLMSETDYGFFKGVNCIGTEPSSADQLGASMAKQLLCEIASEGIVDQSHQWLVCLFMALAQDHKISKALIGTEISSDCAEFIRNIQKFLLVRFKLERQDPLPDHDSEIDTPTAVQGPIRLECIGINMSNTARKTA